jgi:hypothetical protein
VKQLDQSYKDGLMEIRRQFNRTQVEFEVECQCCLMSGKLGCCCGTWSPECEDCLCIKC